MVARARLRTADEDWAAAAELWASVTAANPVNGDYWARLGEARFGAHDYAGAREAYEKVLRLGVRETFLAEDGPPLMPGEVAFRIACCEAAAGDGEAAIAALRVALGRGMRDLSRIRSDEHFAAASCRSGSSTCRPTISSTSSSTPSATIRRRRSRRSATGCSASSRTAAPAGSSSTCGGTAAATRCSASICCIT